MNKKVHECAAWINNQGPSHRHCDHNACREDHEERRKVTECLEGPTERERNIYESIPKARDWRWHFSNDFTNIFFLKKRYFYDSIYMCMLRYWFYDG